MHCLLRALALISALLATAALAEPPPQVEVAPVLGAQFFRGLDGPGLGRDQTIQNGVIVGARGGALFADRLRLDVGLEFTPTVVVGADRLTYVLQPHLDGTVDLLTGWIRPYVGLGVGLIGFVDNQWLGDTITFQSGITAKKPDVEFSGAAAAGVRVYLGEIADMLEGTMLRLDVRDVIYAPRNIAVNYMNIQPGEFNAFHNLQLSLAFAWTFDAFGETPTGETGGVTPTSVP
ncbi:MAG: hypothetical protein JXR83_11970 [Deltaproteobacteria bacterium]|nr:hypothetical protein [Deltaproteobacteria bacterium]